MKRIYMLITMVALVAGLSTAAGAQSWYPQRDRDDRDWRRNGDTYQDRDHDRERGRDGDDRGWYNRGYQQGQSDARSNRRSRFPGGERDDRKAWDRGYEEGY